MKVSDLGEFGLIARLRAQLGATADDRLIIGIWSTRQWNETQRHSGAARQG